MKRVMTALILFMMMVVNVNANVSKQMIENLLKREKILSKEAINAYISGEDINKYLKEMKEINKRILQMASHKDIKDIISYINMEIERINYTYDKNSLNRLLKEIDESREYISMLIKS